jgi:hypothetical protein
VVASAGEGREEQAMQQEMMALMLVERGELLHSPGRVFTVAEVQSALDR